MKTALLALALLLLPAPVLAQDPPEPASDTLPLPSVPIPEEVVRVLRDYEARWEAGDAAGLAALFHPEGFALPSGTPPVQGREAIQRHYADPSGDLRLRAIGYAAADTVAYVVGAYRYGDGPETGKFLLALQRGAADEPWLIAADMDNSHPRR